MKASSASSLPKGKREFDLFFDLNIAQRRGRTVSVHFRCPDIAQRRRGLIVPVLGIYARGETCSGCPQRIKTLWDKSRALVPTPTERSIQ